jgi:hypothetical protein
MKIPCMKIRSLNYLKMSGTEKSELDGTGNENETNQKDTHVIKCPIVTNVHVWYRKVRNEKMSRKNRSTNVDLRKPSGKMPKHKKRRRNSHQTRPQDFEDHVQRLKIAVKRQKQNICNPARPAKQEV